MRVLPLPCSCRLTPAPDILSQILSWLTRGLHFNVRGAIWAGSGGRVFVLLLVSWRRLVVRQPMATSTAFRDLTVAHLLTLHLRAPLPSLLGSKRPGTPTPSFHHANTLPTARIPLSASRLADFQGSLSSYWSLIQELSSSPHWLPGCVWFCSTYLPFPFPDLGFLSSSVGTTEHCVWLAF